MKFRLYLPLAIVTILSASTTVSAQVAPAPPIIAFQGRLAGPDGAPLPDGPYPLTLSLYDAETAGTLKWSQTLPAVPVQRGLFSIEMFTPEEGLYSGNLWLEVAAGTDAAMTPRQRLTAVPYALKANTVPDGAIGAAQIAPFAITPDKLDVSARGWLLRGNAGTDPTDMFLGTTDEQPLVVRTGNAERVRVDALGNVGIGTNSPGARLHVNGGVNNVGVFVGDLAPFGFSPFETNVNANGVTHAWFAEKGERVFSVVGGGAYLKSSLNVGGASPFSNVTSFVQTQPGWYSLYNTDGSRTLVSYHGPAGGVDGVWLGTSSNHPLLLQAGNWAHMVVTPDGRVGIGTLAPTQTLDVNGTAQVKVLRITGGSDVAEPFDIRGKESPMPGMVVSIDPERTGELRLSTAPYDPTVAGIISGANGIQPGMTLSQAGTAADGKHPVALTGRVWCYCDAEAGGPIVPGSLLTSSPTPGHAMNATDPVRRQGAILGKAMSRLDSGKGLVLVLVTLQ